MKLYWYELIFRGVSPGCYPRGVAAVEHDHVNYKGRNFGAVAYEAPLSDDQINSYELEPIDPLRELNEVELFYLNQ